MDNRIGLSVCIITKNEAVKLRRCMEALLKYPVELVIVDTGSADNTVEMCKEMETKWPNIKLGYFEWQDDFAAAKNYAVLQASNEFVMVLDSDEYAETLEFPILKKMISCNPHGVGRILLKNQMEQNGQLLCQMEWRNRIFPKTEYCYEGRIHEQLVRRDKKSYQTYEAPVEIFHDGYMGTAEARRAKAYRNIRLLERELEENGDDPYLLYQLGKGYYMAGEYENAAEYFSRGLTFDLDPKLEYVIDMVETYGYALINSGRSKEAIWFENIQGTFGETADFHILMGFIYMNNERFIDAVGAFEEATHCKKVRTAGADSYLAFYNAGVIEECLGHKEQALFYYRRCGRYEPAEIRIRELKK